MKILIAPDTFKGSLSAPEVCRMIANGIRRFDPGITTLLHPLADGGEGTLDVLKEVILSEKVWVRVHDPLFRPVEAYYLLSGDTAYIEMALASGLELLRPEERNCLYTTTLGTGELVLDAIRRGVSRIFLFVGGSATNDAGTGMAVALGYRFYDAGGIEQVPAGENLRNIARIDKESLFFDPKDLEVVVVCDVKNPLYGADGAAYVYAPQKGADRKAVEWLDEGLRQISEVIKTDMGIDVSGLEGGGAAGGIAAGAAAFLGASLQPGIQTILTHTGFEQKLEDVDLVITGEGKLDRQTGKGKVIQGVAELCKKRNIPVGVICGSIELSDEDLAQMGIRYREQVMKNGVSMEKAMKEASALVEERSFQMMKAYFNRKEARP